MKTRYVINIEAALLERVKRLAEESDRTVSGQLHHLLRIGLDGVASKQPNKATKPSAIEFDNITFGDTDGTAQQ